MGEQVTWTNYLGTGISHTTTVYPFNEDTINDLVMDNIPHGNYRIYERTINNGRYIYTVVYIGRVANRYSDRGLKDRLLEHIGEWPGKLYFECNWEISALAAYRHECRDFHNWKNNEQAKYNEDHPAKLPDSTEKCPICCE